jgi:hypothetical protein
LFQWNDGTAYAYMDVQARLRRGVVSGGDSARLVAFPIYLIGREKRPRKLQL